MVDAFAEEFDLGESIDMDDIIASMEALPEGEYPAVIKKVEWTKAPNTGNQGWNVIFTVNHAGRDRDIYDSIWMSKDAFTKAPRLVRLAIASGVYTKEDIQAWTPRLDSSQTPAIVRVEQFDPQTLVGATVLISLTQDEYGGEVRNKVGRYKAAPLSATGVEYE